MKEENSALQMPLSLSARDPYSSNYYVIHSGVSEALSEFKAQINEIKNNSSSGICFYVFGSRGVGKTHFLNIAKEQATNSGISDVAIYDDLNPQLVKQVEWSREFIGRYQHALRAKGIVLVASTFLPAAFELDPGVASRFEAAHRLELRYPSEEELRPIIESIAERRNLRLSERNVEYIMRRLPLNPLSFEDLFDKIDALCLSSGKSAGLQICRSVIEQRTTT